jgi:hypothetical protein
VLDTKIITQREFDAEKGKDSERALKYEGAIYVLGDYRDNSLDSRSSSRSTRRPAVTAASSGRSGDMPPSSE